MVNLSDWLLGDGRQVEVGRRHPACSITAPRIDEQPFGPHIDYAVAMTGRAMAWKAVDVETMAATLDQRQGDING